MLVIPTVCTVLLVCLFIAVGVYSRLRQPRYHGEPALAATPVYVRGLTKSIAGTPLVTDIDFEVRRGAILGVLGPNGAGKTTILRLLTGLAEPDAGAAYIFGWRVSASAPVLSRVGVCIESPGLLPHRTGRQNLQTLWQVTGRPAAESSLDEVTRLSGLGAALDRKVCEYSLGMRHRLALAQAMLGLPDLLILDEPAHGLDPTQIRFLRRMLGEYAASGRTVVVSSHHLEEVELTCTDVVVVHGGRIVLAGPLSELTGDTTSVAVHVDDPARAQQLFADGAVTARTVGSEIHLDIAAGDVSSALRPLLDAGVRIGSVHSRSRLADAYFRAVGDE